MFLSPRMNSVLGVAPRGHLERQADAGAAGFLVIKAQIDPWAAHRLTFWKSGVWSWDPTCSKMLTWICKTALHQEAERTMSDLSVCGCTVLLDFKSSHPLGLWFQTNWLHKTTLEWGSLSVRLPSQRFWKRLLRKSSLGQLELPRCKDLEEA